MCICMQSYTYTHIHISYVYSICKQKLIAIMIKISIKGHISKYLEKRAVKYTCMEISRTTDQYISQHSKPFPQRAFCETERDRETGSRNRIKEEEAGLTSSRNRIKEEKEKEEI